MSKKNSALIIGVGQYPTGIKKLPAVAADVREIGNLLGSEGGNFKSGEIKVLADTDASRDAILNELRTVLLQATPDQTTFVYMAGHGSLKDRRFFFLPHDTDRNALAETAIPLTEIKEMFDHSPSERLFMWLDFCHSGGILARGDNAPTEASASESIARTLSVVKGEGKVIMCACTPEQSAYEGPSHGHYTQYLLSGLKGAAANSSGEVTPNSLHDYLDQQMGSDQQTPVLHGTVLMHSRSVSSARPVSPFKPVNNAVTVADTGKLVLLDDHFYHADRVQHEAGGLIKLEIATENAEQEANLSGLKGGRLGRSDSVSFAHRNDGTIANVKDVSSEYRGDKLVWSISLQPEPSERFSTFTTEISTTDGGKSYSADDIAALRGRRLLLNDPPLAPTGRTATSSSMLEMLIQGMNLPIKVKQGILPNMKPVPTGDPTEFLEVARLTMVYMLKVSGVFEHILELSVGPLSGNSVHVRCRGKRRAFFMNVPAKEVVIDGDCAL
jgi:hypothetical protein